MQHGPERSPTASLKCHSPLRLAPALHSPERTGKEKPDVFIYLKRERKKRTGRTPAGKEGGGRAAPPPPPPPPPAPAPAGSASAATAPAVGVGRRSPPPHPPRPPLLRAQPRPAPGSFCPSSSLLTESPFKAFQ